MNVFEAVKENVTARQAAEMYGIRVNRNGMACCPFHDDRHPSMKVDKRFHCFGCQADGDVINLVARLYGLNNLGAAVKLASDFGISYDNKGRASPRPVKKKISEELKLKQAELQCCRILSDYNHLLEKWKTEYVPETPGGRMASPVRGGFAEADLYRISAGYPAGRHGRGKSRHYKRAWKGSDADWGTDFRTCRQPQGRLS